MTEPVGKVIRRRDNGAGQFFDVQWLRPEALQEGDQLVILPKGKDRLEWLQEQLQRVYDGGEFETDGLRISCSMLSGYKGERTVSAHIIWRDVRDEPLDLIGAIERAQGDAS